jgi:hypothetical protein
MPGGGKYVKTYRVEAPNENHPPSSSLAPVLRGEGRGEGFFVSIERLIEEKKPSPLTPLA